MHAVAPNRRRSSSAAGSAGDAAAPLSGAGGRDPAEPPPPPPPPRIPDFTKLTVSELQAAAKSAGLKNTSKLRKAELVGLLMESYGGAAGGTAHKPETVPAAEGSAAAAAAQPAPTSRRRTRARTAETEEDGGAAGAGGGPGVGAGAVPGITAAAAQRKASARRAAGAAPEVKTEKEEGCVTRDPDPVLDELFAAMDLDISIAMRDPREAQDAASTSRPASTSARAPARGAAGSGGGRGAAEAPELVRRRRAAESMDPDLDPGSGSELGPAAGARDDSGGGAAPPRRRTAPSVAESESAAAPAEGATRRRPLAVAGHSGSSEPGPSSSLSSSSSSSSTSGGAPKVSRAPAAGSAAASPSVSEDADPDSDLESDLGPEYDLPPWPPLFLGELRSVDQIAPGDRDAQEELLLGNVAGMSLTVLGSAAVRPTANRALASLAMARVKDIFIFDAGDDTQRQVAHAYQVKPSKIFRIFLTSLEPECVLGLPGLMCIINASRERGHEIADIPVHVYGPPGTADFLASMMRVSHTCLEVTIVVHEISTEPVPTGESEPYLYVRRARIWRVAMPPDQLNPRGGVDASLLLFAPDQGRSQKKRGRNAAGGVLSFDTRAGFLPFPPLEPGDPYRRGIDPRDMSWTLECDITARIVINMLPGARGPVLSYTVQEADRGGALVMERATAAGLVAGRDIARLKAGEAVTNSWGHLVSPSLVVSPNRPGRRMVVLGNTSDPSALSPESYPHMAGADVLVAGAVWPQDEADAAAATGGCTTDALGRAAGRLGVRYVLLSRFDGSRLDEQEGYAERAAAEVAAAAAAATVVAPKRRGGGGAARGGGGGGQRSAADWRRRVLALSDLESAILDKNEGPREREREGLPALVA